jgi:hypothetical protein
VRLRLYRIPEHEGWTRQALTQFAGIPVTAGPDGTVVGRVVRAWAEDGWIIAETLPAASPQEGEVVGDG